MNQLDITGKIGNLFHQEPEWPMYSYDRPSWLVWNAMANVFHDNGWSEDKIKTWLQSKEPRWSLDGALGDALQEVGRKYAVDMLNK